MSNFTPSKYQQAIFDFVAHGEGNAIIRAVAGSGKTTTIVQALKLTRHTACFLAFNKSIADELKKRVPNHVQARTFHSLCFRPVLNAVKARDVNPNKLDQIIKLALPMAEAAMYRAFVKRLVGLAKSVGLGCLHEASESNFYALVENHDLTLEAEKATVEKGIQWAMHVLELSNDSDEVDFDDLLYFAVLKGIQLPTFYWVFVDEAQDTNSIQRAILRKIMMPGGRLVAVGDPAQAIYGFRGADSTALDLLAEDFEPCISLPLSVSYRCPLAVVRKAKGYVSQIEPADGAPEGLVQELGVKWKLSDFGQHDIIVCRNTKPLLELGYRLLKAQIPLRILGRDIGEGLISLIRKCTENDDDVETMLAHVQQWAERESQKAIAKGNEAKAESIFDKSEAVHMLTDALPEGNRKVSDLIAIIQQLFTDQNSRVTLATIHKAKGLEADTVWWLAPSLCPSKWARKPWQKVQETNLMYVATTRAKQRLVLIEMPKAGDQK